MGSQLWKSKITDYRRKGTRFSEIRLLFEEGITSKSILEPLMACSQNSPAFEIKRKLKKLEFDVIGVSESEDSQINCYVSTENLEDGQVGDYTQEIQTVDLISDSTPLADIFNVFKNRERVFILIGQSIKGIITRADLNKPPVRIYLFSLISLLEMHFTYLINEMYENNSWKSELYEKRLDNAYS